MTQQFIIPNNQYVFNKTAKTITFPYADDYQLEGFQLITNLTTGTIIYQFNDVAKKGTFAKNILTLAFDTSSMSNTDNLQILYNPPVNGFFDKAILYLRGILDALLFPEWVSNGVSGKALNAKLDSGTVTTVSTVTNITNFDSIPSSEAILSIQRVEAQMLYDAILIRS